MNRPVEGFYLLKADGELPTLRGIFDLNTIQPLPLEEDCLEYSQSLKTTLANHFGISYREMVESNTWFRRYSPTSLNIADYLPRVSYEIPLPLYFLKGVVYAPNWELFDSVRRNFLLLVVYILIIAKLSHITSATRIKYHRQSSSLGLHFLY